MATPPVASLGSFSTSSSPYDTPPISSSTAPPSSNGSVRGPYSGHSGMSSGPRASRWVGQNDTARSAFPASGAWEDTPGDRSTSIQDTRPVSHVGDAAGLGAESIDSALKHAHLSALNTLVAQLLPTLSIRGHRHMFVVYVNTVTGSEVVGAMVKLGAARDRFEAISIGNELIATGLLCHARDPRQPFKDKASSLYRFSAHGGTGPKGKTIVTPELRGTVTPGQRPRYSATSASASARRSLFATVHDLPSIDDNDSETVSVWNDDSTSYGPSGSRRTSFATDVPDGPPPVHARERRASSHTASEASFVVDSARYNAGPVRDSPAPLASSASPPKGSPPNSSPVHSASPAPSKPPRPPPKLPLAAPPPVDEHRHHSSGERPPSHEKPAAPPVVRSVSFGREESLAPNGNSHPSPQAEQSAAAAPVAQQTPTVPSSWLQPTTNVALPLTAELQPVTARLPPPAPPEDMHAVRRIAPSRRDVVDQHDDSQVVHRNPATASRKSIFHGSANVRQAATVHAEGSPTTTSLVEPTSTATSSQFPNQRKQLVTFILLSGIGLALVLQLLLLFIDATQRDLPVSRLAASMYYPFLFLMLIVALFFHMDLWPLPPHLFRYPWMPNS